MSAEWVVPDEKGRPLVYVAKEFTGDGRPRVVTIYRDVRNPGRPLSEKRRRPDESLNGGGQPRPARAGIQDTDPATSSSSVGRSLDGITSLPRSAGESTPDPVRQAASERPDLQVALFIDQEGKAVPLTAREALEQADAEFAQAQADARARLKRWSHALSVQATSRETGARAHLNGG